MLKTPESSPKNTEVNMKKFEVITDIYFSTNALDRLKDIGYKKVFIVSDPFVVQSGIIRNVTRPLDQAGIAYDIYTDVVADPTVEKVIAGITAV